MSKVLIVFGTRPEAIKMAPLCRELYNRKGIETLVCSTGQHQEMLQQVLNVFDIKPDINLDVMQPNQTLTQLSCRLLQQFEKVLTTYKPDSVLVHGDTTTSFICALAAFYKRIAVGHVEAGLRTHNLDSPWPEEGNRCLNRVIAKWHFAPTITAKDNLIREGVSAQHITITGNTAIDALSTTVDNIARDPLLKTYCRQALPKNLQQKLVLVTGHRRENFNSGMQNICAALKDISLKNPDVSIVYPVHLNPNIQRPVYQLLADIENVHLIRPLDYLQFVYAMQLSTVILTDSGGIQEEAPSLKKPVLVMRDTSERPEAVALNLAKLVGSDRATIASEVQQLLDSVEKRKAMQQAQNPYGDGRACKYIADVLVAHYLGAT